MKLVSKNFLQIYNRVNEETRIQKKFDPRILYYEAQAHNVNNGPSGKPKTIGDIILL